jgi:hypothetical protein
MPARYNYQVNCQDLRVWVFDGCECIGWIDLETNKLRLFVSEAQSNAMLADALKKKPTQPE